MQFFLAAARGYDDLLNRLIAGVRKLLLRVRHLHGRVGVCSRSYAFGGGVRHKIVGERSDCGKNRYGSSAGEKKTAEFKLFHVVPHVTFLISETASLCFGLGVSELIAK